MTITADQAARTGRTYRVVVTREGSHWLADVPELEGSATDAANLTTLDRYVREVIVLGADLPDELMPMLSIDYVYDLDDDLVRTAVAARQERVDLERREAQLQAHTAHLAHELVVCGYSARDAAQLLGISHQRVSQIVREHRAAVGEDVNKARKAGRRRTTAA